jgi:hypothetical protein
MIYTKNNSGYICHRCFYISFTKNDMYKHCNKKNICKASYNCLFSDEEYKKLSLNNRYIFTEFDEESKKTIYNLSVNQLIFLVTKFNNELNIIENHNLLTNEVLSKQNITQINNIKEDIISDEKDEDIQNIINEDDYIIYIDGIRHFKCILCGSIYKRKDSLQKHLKNKLNCENKLLFNNLLLKKKEEKEEKDQKNVMIQNINNNNNIQNIQNNNNSTQNNNYNLEIKDFIESNYDHKHIPYNVIRDKNFYLYKNFLNLILQNDVNKNIYFDGKYAFLYSDGGLKRIPNDKAGYLLLDKLDSAIKSYIYSNPENNNSDDYDYVYKYYSVTKNKYVYDTIYKPYDVETKKFNYCMTNNIRTRDKCLSDITQTCNSYKEKTKQIMKDKEYDKHEIDSNYQVNIPFYESSKMRNKAFLDNDKYY